MDTIRDTGNPSKTPPLARLHELPVMPLKEHVLQNPDLPDPESSVPHAPHEVILLQAAVCRHQL